MSEKPREIDLYSYRAGERQAKADIKRTHVPRTCPACCDGSGFVVDHVDALDVGADTDAPTVPLRVPCDQCAPCSECGGTGELEIDTGNPEHYAADACPHCTNGRKRVKGCGECLECRIAEMPHPPTMRGLSGAERHHLSALKNHADVVRQRDEAREALEKMANNIENLVQQMRVPVGVSLVTRTKNLAHYFCEMQRIESIARAALEKMNTKGDPND